MVGVAVPSGDPVGGGDDIDPGLKHFHVEVLVGEDAVESQYIGFGGDDLVDAAGCLDAVGWQADEFGDILADLLRRVTMHADQFQVGLSGDALDHLGTDVAGRDLENLDWGRHGVTFS